MFGDIGHGTIIACAALYMILSERKLAKQDLGEVCLYLNVRSVEDSTRILDNWAVLFVRLKSHCITIILTLSDTRSGRYIILLMGLFSIYTGFIYNDIFSKSLHLFHSGWTFPHSNDTGTAVANGHMYPFGLDPGWHGADNGLVFTNSFKMKMSIVLGVTHVRRSYFFCLSP